MFDVNSYMNIRYLEPTSVFWRYGVDERLREFIYMTSPHSPSLLALCWFHTAFCTL